MQNINGEREITEYMKMNGQFHFGRCIRIAGPSQCGKTWTLCKLLENKANFFPHAPRRIVWISGSNVCDENLETKIKAMYPASQFFYHIPEDISSMAREFDFWVFDDMSSELKNNAEFTNFFTKTAHHKNCLMAYLTQNAYKQGRDAAMQTRNCAYQIYFNNKADRRWIRVLGDQLLGNHKQFANLFQKAMQRPYNCLLLDNQSTTPPHKQFIGNAFCSTDDDPTYFLIPHK